MLKHILGLIPKGQNQQVLIACLLLPLLHYGVVQVALSLAFDDNGVLVLWPSTGIYLAATLILGHRVWPAILLSELLVNPTLYGLIPASFALSGIDFIDPMLTAFIINRFLPQKGVLDAVSGTFQFIGILLMSPTLTSTLGVTVLCLAGFAEWGDFTVAWWAWWVSLVMGMAIVTPAILAWVPRFLGFKVQRSFCSLESLLILCLGGIICYLCFIQSYPVEYILLPLLGWAAIRLDKRLVTLDISLIAVIAIFTTAHGNGSFVRSSTTESLVLLQSFIGVITLTTLLLSAAISQNDLSEQSLREANDCLEQRVEMRTSELQETLQQLRQTQAHIVQSEKMSALGQMVAGVAHEINNPVNFIHGNLKHVQNYTDDLLGLINLYQHHVPNPPDEIEAEVDNIDLSFLQEDLAKVVSSMHMGTQRIREIVLSLRNFSRLDEADYKTVDLHSGIDSTLTILQNQLKAKSGESDIQLIKAYGDIPPVECYAGQLNQVYLNILSNAIDALKTHDQKRSPEEKAQSPSTIEIYTAIKNETWVAIHITDNGPGMDDDVRSQIFNPFFTTKPVGQGTGLGLSISYQIIVERHHGRLTCDSNPGQGTKFVIELPIKQPDAPATV